jgi:hypothetical protein
MLARSEIATEPRERSPVLGSLVVALSVLGGGIMDPEEVLNLHSSVHHHTLHNLATDTSA